MKSDIKAARKGWPQPMIVKDLCDDLEEARRLAKRFGEHWHQCGYLVGGKCNCGWEQAQEWLEGKEQG